MAITTDSTISIPFTYSNTVASGAGLYTDASGFTVTAAQAVQFSPTMAGGRTLLLSGLYTQWRVVRGRIIYRSLIPTSGGGSALTGSAAFCMGWGPDPAFFPNNYNQAVQNGGRQGSIDRNMSVSVPRSSWKWIEAGMSATPADQRLQNHGSLFFFAFALPANALATYGSINLEVTWQFRGVAPQDDSISQIPIYPRNLASVENPKKETTEEKSPFGDTDSESAFVRLDEPHSLALAIQSRAAATSLSKTSLTTSVVGVNHKIPKKVA